MARMFQGSGDLALEEEVLLTIRFMAVAIGGYCGGGADSLHGDRWPRSFENPLQGVYIFSNSNNI